MQTERISMKYIGVHLDVAPPLAAIPEAAKTLGADAFSFCPIDARRYTDKHYTQHDIEEFKIACETLGYKADMILPHASLIVNPCSPDARKLSLSRMSLIDQMKRCDSLGLKMLNFHPGATLKEMDESNAIKLVAASINYILEHTMNVCAVIENTAGQGSNIGYDFRHIAEILSLVDDKNRIGVCIDTCHANAAGYDFSTEEAFCKTWELFDNIIGFKYLKGMHINDSMRNTGSRIDRHAPIGKGILGKEFFSLLMKDSRFDGIPLILETPDPTLWKLEIEWLKAQSNNK